MQFKAVFTLTKFMEPSFNVGLYKINRSVYLCRINNTLEGRKVVLFILPMTSDADLK